MNRRKAQWQYWSITNCRKEDARPFELCIGESRQRRGNLLRAPVREPQRISLAEQCIFVTTTFAARVERVTLTTIRIRS
jgi:hypothetical protein